MSTVVILIENLSKAYHLGQIGTGTLTNDLRVWWAKKRGLPNPFLKIGQEDQGNRDGEMVWALKDVSLQVERGEVLGIIGRNGAGKSTLLKILSRVTAPTSGKVKVKGRIASLLEVGTGFHPDMTGRENIYLNGAILGMTKEEVRRKFDEIISFSEVERFVDTPVKRYSSGMFVRLAFAVAAHLEPEILIVDEVLAVGDAEFQKKCLGKMKGVSEEGRTVLFVSHNMGMIRSLCPKTLLLSEGKIAAIGITDEITKLYLDRFNIILSDEGSYHNDLTKMEHSGSGEAKIVWAEIKNSKNVNTLFFEMDEAIQIIFGINNPHDLKLNFAIEVLDKNEYPLFHFLSEYEKTQVFTKGTALTSAIVQIKIPPLFLFPDNYLINLWAGIHNNRVDKVEKCFQIQILKKSNVERDLPTTRGRIFSQAEWTVTYDGEVHKPFLINRR